MFISDDIDTDPSAAERAEVAMARVSQKMQRHPDFPAMQAAVKRVQRVARDERAHLRALVDAVITDPALTSRLLRLTSTAHYRGAGGITSVQRAIAVMGFDTVQRLAMGVRLLDALPRNDGGLLLREDFLRAVLAGRLAGEMCLEVRKQEDAHMVAQFQNLGRMVAAHHLADDALAIRRQVPRNTWPLGETEQLAALRHLGLRYSDLGAHVARTWGWPESLRHAMRRGDWPLHAVRSGQEALRWLGWLANDLADVLLYTDPSLWADRCERLALAAGPATGQTAAAMLGALARVRTKLEHLADAVGLPVSQLRQWHQADPLAGTPRHAPSTAETPSSAPAWVPPVAQAQMAQTAQAAQTAWASAAQPGPKPLGDLGDVSALAPRFAHADAATLPMLKGTALLAHAAQSLSDELLGPQRRTQVPRRALRALWQGLHPRRAVMCLPPPGEPNAPWAVAQVLGEPLREDPALPWRVDPARGRDLFSRLCAHGSDGLIDDARHGDIAPHLPESFLRGANARCFMVLPLVAQGQPLGMIYLDRGDNDPFTIDDHDMQLVRVLRNQATLALVD